MHSFTERKGKHNHTGHRGGPAIVTSHDGRYIVLIVISLLFLLSVVKLSEMRPAGIGVNAAGAAGVAPLQTPPLAAYGASILASSALDLQKIFLKLNLDFILAEIRGVFGSVGDVCVCE